MLKLLKVKTNDLRILQLINQLYLVNEAKSYRVYK